MSDESYLQRADTLTAYFARWRIEFPQTWDVRFLFVAHWQALLTSQEQINRDDFVELVSACTDGFVGGTAFEEFMWLIRSWASEQV